MSSIKQSVKKSPDDLKGKKSTEKYQEIKFEAPVEAIESIQSLSELNGLSFNDQVLDLLRLGALAEMKKMLDEIA